MSNFIFKILNEGLMFKWNIEHTSNSIQIKLLDKQKNIGECFIELFNTNEFFIDGADKINEQFKQPIANISQLFIEKNIGIKDMQK